MTRPDARSAAIALLAVILIEAGLAAFAAVIAWRSPDVTTEPLGQLTWLAIEALLVWAVWRRSTVALFLLFALIALPALLLLLTTIEGETWVLVLLAGALVQLTLLLSPAVRRHVRRTEQARTGSDATRATR